MPASGLVRTGLAFCRVALSLALVAVSIRFSDTRLASPPTAWAAGYTVNQVADPGDGACDETCTLRDAIQAANASPGADTIDFNLDGTIMLSAALPAITDTLTIDGGGWAVTVDGDNAFRVFSATAPLTLTTLIVQKGNGSLGGGAFFGSPAVVMDVTFLDNNTSSFGDGGGAYFADTAVLSGADFLDNSGDQGGGAYFAAAATLTGTTFISNTTSADGAGAYFADTAAVAGATFSGNVVGFGHGGGASFRAGADVSGTTFFANVSQGSGHSGGGAAFYGPSTIVNTDFISNSSAFGGGASIFGTAIVTAATFISNTASNSFAGGAGANVTGSDTVFANSLFQANVATGQGGGLRIQSAANIQLSANRFYSNQAGIRGGGLFLISGASANLDNNVLAANSAVSPTNPAEISLAGENTSLTGRHNTLTSAPSASSGLAVGAGDLELGQTVALTNTIFDGYAVGVQAGDSTPAITLDGVLWSDVTLSTQGADIAVTNAYTGAAAFVNPAARDYHLHAASDAIDVGVSTGLSVDFDSGGRPLGLGPDLGADEYLAPIDPTAPTAVDDTASTPVDTSVTVSVLENDFDLNGDPLSVIAVGLPSSGAAVISGTTQIVYAPSLNFTGPAVFTYTASDGALSDTATVTVTVTPPNNSPTISALDDLTITVDSSSGPLLFMVDDVESGSALTVTASSTNTTLVPTANVELGGGFTRTVTVTPAAGMTGQAGITLTVSDGDGGTAQETFVLTVVIVEYKLFLPLVRR